MTITWNGTLNKESLGSYLRSLRSRALLPLKVLASILGMSPNTLFMIEKNRAVPKKATVEKILNALNASVEESETAFGLLESLNLAAHWDGVLHTESIGSYLRSLRQRALLSLTALCGIIDMGVCNLSAVETGKAVPYKTTVEKILNAVNASEEERKTAFMLLNEASWDGVIHTESFGAYVRSLRRRAGMSIYDIENLTRISASGLALIETGKAKPYCYTIKKLAEAIPMSDTEEEMLMLLATKDSANIYGLKTARIEQGLTLTALAEMVGISEPYLCNIENGKANPSAEVLSRLLKAV